MLGAERRCGECVKERESFCVCVCVCVWVGDGVSGPVVHPAFLAQKSPLRLQILTCHPHIIVRERGRKRDRRR